MNTYRMQIELTNRCNMRCVLCPHAYWRLGPGPSGNEFDRQQGHMAMGRWDECLSAAWTHARVVQLGYFGEQMMHPDFERMMQRIPMDRPYRVVLNTNWSLATSAMFPTLRRSVDCMEISLDTMDPALYEELCPGPMVRGVDGEWRHDRHAAIVEKAEAWLSGPHPMTELVFVTSERNKGEREAFAAYWKPRLRTTDVLYMKTAISYGGVTRDDYMTAGECPGVENRITVAWDGRVTPCNLDVNVALCVGTLVHAVDMATILEGDALKACKERISRREGICANCFDANNTAGLETVWGGKE